MNNLVIIHSNVQNHDIHIYKLDPQFGIEQYSYEQMCDFIEEELGFDIDYVEWFIDYDTTHISVYPVVDGSEDPITYIAI